MLGARRSHRRRQRRSRAVRCQGRQGGAEDDDRCERLGGCGSAVRRRVRAEDGPRHGLNPQRNQHNRQRTNTNKHYTKYIITHLSLKYQKSPKKRLQRWAYTRRTFISIICFGNINYSLHYFKHIIRTISPNLPMLSVFGYVNEIIKII